MGTPCETHLSLGYASISLSRQAGSIPMKSIVPVDWEELHSSYLAILLSMLIMRGQEGQGSTPENQVQRRTSVGPCSQYTAKRFLSLTCTSYRSPSTAITTSSSLSFTAQVFSAERKPGGLVIGPSTEEPVRLHFLIRSWDRLHVKHLKGERGRRRGLINHSPTDDPNPQLWPEGGRGHTNTGPTTTQKETKKDV
ncbi:hypothetical protein FQN60_017749 [Etheostoma spectabile]|uniref:Uncharacterized protein n=1 Tax=Etheostoma spectabile TaxID=54343 RepID=A0A5J5DG09_9PERO|nr:hypothetical protein FQN60_017749 [Etheostoma spectabile]